jgi:hypothetical protein
MLAESLVEVLVCNRIRLAGTNVSLLANREVAVKKRKSKFIVGRVSKLKLQPGDRLVAELPINTNEAERDSAVRVLERFLPTGVEVVVFIGAKLKVLKGVHTNGTAGNGTSV